MIAKQKGNKAIVALAGAVICYVVLFLFENADPILILDFIFGNEEDGYANFNSMLLILGMITMIDITMDSGLFQFVGFSLIKKTRGNPFKLFLVITTFTVLISTVLDNMLVLMIMIPLTISISRLLEIKPLPYLLSVAVLVNIGGTVFTISSISNIIIANFAEIPFLEYFFNAGLISLIISACSIVFLYFLTRKQLTSPIRNITVLLDYDAWIFVSDKKLMYKSAMVFLVVIGCIIAVPPSIFPSDLIALTGMFILILISRLNTNEILKAVDVELFLYLIGISIVTGSINYSGIMEYFGTLLGAMGSNDPMSFNIMILWVSAALSVTVDNVPITQILLPTLRSLTQPFTQSQARQSYYALTLGVGWGDSLTPFGDNIIVQKLADQHKVKIPLGEFFKVGFFSGMFQLALATVFFALMESIMVALILIFCIFGAIIGITLLWKKIKPIVQKKMTGETRSHSFSDKWLNRRRTTR